MNHSRRSVQASRLQSSVTTHHDHHHDLYTETYRAACHAIKLDRLGQFVQASQQYKKVIEVGCSFFFPPLPLETSRVCLSHAFIHGDDAQY